MLLESFARARAEAGRAGLLPAVGDVKAKLDADKPRIDHRCRLPPDAHRHRSLHRWRRVFVPVPKPLGPPADGKQSFVVSFVSPAEAAAIKGKTLTLTLISDRGSTETTGTRE